MSTIETDLVQAATGSNTALKLKGKGSGVVKIGDGELSFPDADGSSGQVIKTDGSGALSFTTSPAANSVDSDQYVDGSIDNAHIADDAIDSEHYAAGSIDTAHLGDLQVTTAKIAADAITSAKIADDAIDSEHYTDASIDTAHLGALQVTTAKIAADAITSAKIADDAIDSEHYTDGSIDIAHLADDAVTLAKMAAGTDGNLISYDTSGNPVAVAAGSDGQVLTSAGAGAVCLFEDAAGGMGALLGSATASNSATLTVTGLTGKPAIIVMAGMHPATAFARLYLRLGDGSGVDSGASDYDSAGQRIEDGGSSGSSTGGTPVAAIYIGGGEVGSATGEGISSTGYLWNGQGTNQYPAVFGTAIIRNGGDATQAIHYAGTRLSAITTDRVQVLFSSGNIVSGVLYVYELNIT